MPTLVLVARSDVDEVARSKIVASCRALNAGSKAFLVDVDGARGAPHASLGEFRPALDRAVRVRRIGRAVMMVEQDGGSQYERAAIGE